MRDVCFIADLAVLPRWMRVADALDYAACASCALAANASPTSPMLIALAVASLCLSAVENMNVMSMLSLSEAYSKAGAADRQAFEALRVVVASARNWAHYIGLIVHGGTIFTFYAALYRSALIPRSLAALGLTAVTLQLIAVAMPLFGHGVVFVLLAPLGVSQLLLAVWLIAKGFRIQESSGDPVR